MNKNLHGVLWALVSAALFSIEAAMAKFAVAEYHVLQILFFRQVFIFMSALPQIVKTFPAGLKTQHPVIHTVRLLAAFVALSSGIWAVAVLPLTTATTLGFSKVLFGAVLALWFLRERVGVHRLAAVVIGFCGVVVAMQPGTSGLADVHVLIPITGAFAAAVALICVRRLSQTDSTATLLTYQAVFIGLMSAIPLFWLWVMPNFSDFLLLSFIGILATAGQWIAIKALRLAEASVVGNVQYLQLVYAAILGFILFAEIPQPLTIAGAAIIISSSIYIFHREAVKGRSTE